MKKTELLELYSDSKKCAEQIGLTYSSDNVPGITRIKKGKGWAFKDEQGIFISDARSKEDLLKLGIPPAWNNVWICPGLKGHIVATGIDDKGRKQYIYHQNWRTIRDLLNFYKLISFGDNLPAIRRTVKKQLKKDAALDREQVLSLMLWFLDNGYIRIGNEVYFEENESVGLATLGRDHVSISSDTVRLSFIGKSNQEHVIEMKNQNAAYLLKQLLKRPGDRVFVNEDGRPYNASDCNAYLHSIATDSISAKNFRTWGGTLAAFEYLKKNQQTDEKSEKVIIKAVDKAAEVLGNTRAVAKTHYVHPHILETYAKDDFSSLYKKIKRKNTRELTKGENELLAFLELLFKREFESLVTKNGL